MKRIQAVFLALILFLFCVVNVHAGGTYNLGELSYWYSDSNKIGRWNYPCINMCYTKISTNPSFPFETAMNHGKTQWNSALTNFTIISNSLSECKISFYGGTYAQLVDVVYGFYNEPSSTVGYSNVYYQDEGTWTYGSSSKRGVELVFAEAGIVDNGSTTNEYKGTCTHEIGHCLGWFGHAGSSSDIMYAYVNNETSLSIYDKRHLVQVY